MTNSKCNSIYETISFTFIADTFYYTQQLIWWEPKIWDFRGFLIASLCSFVLSCDTQLPILYYQKHTMPATMDDVSNHARSQQPHTMPATMGDSSTMPATTHNLSNYTCCQQPWAMPAKTLDASDHMRYS